MRRYLLSLMALIFAFVLYWPKSKPFLIQPAYSHMHSSQTVAPMLITVAPSLEQQEDSTSVTPGETSSLRQWVKAETLEVGRTDVDPAQTKERLDKKSLALTPSDLTELKSIALDEQQNGDSKFLAIYMIGLAKSPEALDLLKQIGQEPISADQNERAYSDSTVVRLHALDSLAKRLPAQETSSYLKQVLLSSAAPPVAKHAEHLLSHL